ncbi:hypothetical protein M758_5G106300 [Ceratodon purpureus]|nr:hypothetical protein M758_5G106300 [Ceratodon purpureus]
MPWYHRNRTYSSTVSGSAGIQRSQTDSILLASSPMKTSHVWAVCVTALLCLHLGTTVTDGAEVRFDYTNGPNGPANWGNFPGWETCKTGRMQSPMLITPDIMVTDKKLDAKLGTNYPKCPIPANISNNGHTIEVAVSGLELKINKVKYYSRQMHVHYPSEHTILGYTFPLELHLVHVEPATGKIAVIGWLFTLGADSPFLAQFFDNLPTYTPGSEETFPIDPIKFLLSTEGTYGRYMGSLTTPPCSEGVTWTLMLWDFPTVSTNQLNLLKAALPEANARPTQPANGRKLRIST